MGRGAAGHTLIELLVVIAVIAVIAAVAIPLYDNYGQKARREAIKATILDIATAEERFFALRGHYVADFVPLIAFGGSAGWTSTPDGFQKDNFKYFVGIHVKQVMGPGFTIIGKGNVDGHGDTIEECWLYYSRNMQRPSGVTGDLVWLYDDVSNRNMTIVPGMNPADLCKW